jgi:hypothetical protein
MAKPELILTEPTVDGLVAMFERLTGRKMTPLACSCMTYLNSPIRERKETLGKNEPRLTIRPDPLDACISK